MDAIISPNIFMFFLCIENPNNNIDRPEIKFNPIIIYLVVPSCQLLLKTSIINCLMISLPTKYDKNIMINKSVVLGEVCRLS